MPSASQSTIGGSARILSGCILLSRILGFIRDMLCGGFFGWVWDAFVLAFTIPNLFRRLFGEGALSSAFIPTFSDYLTHKPQSETQRFINIVTTTLAVILGGIALIIIGVSFLLPQVMTSDKNPDYIPLFALLLRIMIPYLPIICLVALLTAILNSLKHFVVPALASVVLNISWIAAFVIAPLMTKDPERQVVIIAWAIIIGGVFELLMQIPPLLARGFSYKPAWQFNHPGVKETMRLMGPATFGLAVFQINLLVDYIIALSFVRTDGAISALYFGNRIMQFPLALIGISLATASFPFLTEYVSRNNLVELKKEVGRTLRLAMFVAIPAGIGLIVLVGPIVDLGFNILPKVMFKAKGFDAGATSRTALVLAFYSLGIWAYCGLQIINRVFYAFKDTKTPVRVGIWTVAANLVLNIILVQFLAEGGIALATAVTAMANFFILFYLAQKKIAVPSSDASGQGWQREDFSLPFLKSLVVSLVMGNFCYLALFGSYHLVTGMPLVLGGIIQVCLPLLVGVISYFVLSWFLQRAQLKEFWNTFIKSSK